MIVLAALAAPLITQHGPTDQDLLHTLQGPSSSHWLGTDDLGRDVWSRLVYGARTDLHIAFLAVVLPFMIGTLVGLLAGYYGGLTDTFASCLVNVVVAFPFYVLIIALVFALGSGSRNIYIAITIVGWVSYTRIIRGEVFVAKRQDYVLAAKSRRALGRPDHLPPPAAERDHAGGGLRVSDIVLDILAIVTLGYLGLGVQPPTPDWGNMIATARRT